MSLHPLPSPRRLKRPQWSCLSPQYDEGPIISIHICGVSIPRQFTEEHVQEWAENSDRPKLFQKIIVYFKDVQRDNFLNMYVETRLS